jgi:acetyltransferase-like isoleucine patch superfamily enzyme
MSYSKTDTSQNVKKESAQYQAELYGVGGLMPSIDSLRNVLKSSRGAGTKVWNPELSYISPDFTAGENCMIASMVHIDRDVIIGNDVRIQGMVYIPPKTRIGNNVFIAPQVGFSNDRYPPSENLQGVTVEDNVIIGFGVKIIGGIRIGMNSIVGMGSIVTNDIPADEVWYGNPAKFKYTSKEYWSKKNG